MIAWNCNRLYFDWFIKINTYIPLNIVQIQKLAIEKKHTVSTVYKFTEDIEDLFF